MTKKIVKLPLALQASEAYYDNPEKATKMWEEGFRPIRAKDLRHDMRVAYRETDVFQFEPVGPIKEGLIREVTYDYDSALVKVYHSGTVTEADEYDEVWAKPKEED